MKIKYIQLHKRLNIPGVVGTGVGAANRISANGLDGSFNGACKVIVPFGSGYLLHVAGGPNAGFFEVPSHSVDHVGWDFTLNDQHAQGYISDGVWDEVQLFAQLAPQEQAIAATTLGFSQALVKQIHAEFGSPKSATDDGAKSQTEPGADDV